MFKKIVSIAAIALLAGCAGLNDTEQRALTGTAGGAAAGAAIGAIAGNAALGSVIGAGAGLATGLVVDKVQKDKQSAYEQGVAAGRSGG